MAADIAAAAAALAYNATGDETIAAKQACVAAAMNGIAVTCTTPIPSTVQTSFGTAPNGSGLQGVHVVVSTTLQLSAFGSLLYPQAHHNRLPVHAGAWAAINSNTPPCLEALVPSNGGVTGIGLTGSAAIDAPGCSIESGGPISVTGGTTMIAQSVISGSTITHTIGTTFTSTTAPKPNYSYPPPAPSTTAPDDPFADNATVTAGFSHLTSVQSYSAATNNPLPNMTTGTQSYTSPTTGKGNKTTPVCVSNAATIAGGTYVDVTLDEASCAYTMTGPLSISGTLTIGDSSGNVGGVTVIFPNNSTYNINAIKNLASTAVIKSSGSTFNVYNGVKVGANAAELSIGCSATFTATVTGQAYNGCSGSDPYTNTFAIKGGVSAPSAGALVFGNGNFTISGGISIGNGTACGPTNTIQFGNGSSFIVTDTGVSLVGGCLIFGNATNHDINGGGASGYAINNSGGTAMVTFGSGTYTLNGGVQLQGASTSTGSNMTLVMSGDLNLAAGANNVNWSAPAASPFLILTSSSDGGNGSTSPAAVSLSGGTGGTQFTGAVYAPNGGLVLSGSGAINANTTSNCFSLVARVITQSGGTATAGVCPNTGSGTGGAVALIQ